MAQLAQSYEIDAILSSGQLLREHAAFGPILLLLMLGAFTKSAQFPFHFWLPNAMSAPTPASAFLHSATMVKAGVYLMLRFYPVLGDNDLWMGGLLSIGLLTMFIGAFWAICQRDLKGCFGLLNGQLAGRADGADRLAERLRPDGGSGRHFGTCHVQGRAVFDRRDGRS